MQEMQETWVQPLGWKDHLERRTTTYSTILAWRISWAEEPGRHDGVVTAGIDLTDAKIDMREDTKRIYVLLPEAEIMSVEIDFNSFQKYSEREGIGNRITLENYNDALKSIDETARQKAVDKGILNRAYENAQVIVQRMIGSLVDLNEYSLEIGRDYP